MKKLMGWMVLLSVLFALTSCKSNKNDNFDINSIKSHTDVPGVEDDEIEAIEALKEMNDAFYYGHVTETEAFEYTDGSYTGFTYLFCDFLTELFGVEFIPKYYDAWDDLKKELDDATLDFMGGMTPTLERMQFYYMTHPIAERALRIYTLENKRIETEMEMDGLTVGFLTGTITADQIKKFYPIDFTKVEIDSFTTAVEKMQSGEVDAFVTEAVAEPAFEEHEFIHSKELFPLSYTSVSMTTVNDDLQPIISVVNKYIDAGGFEHLSDLYKEGDYQYAKFKLESILTKTEKEYLDNLKTDNATVSIALEDENYPVCFYNEADKEYQGIAVDVLNEISELTDIQFEVKNKIGTPWEETLEQLKTGEISMVTELLCSEEKKTDYITGSQPYASSNIIFLSKASHPNVSSHQVVRTKVGIIDHSIFKEFYHTWFPESGNIISYSTFGEALDALENEEVDLLLATENFLLTQSNYREKPGYKVNVRFNAPMESQFGFHKNEKTLQSIINKAQTFINAEAVEEVWTGRVFDYSKKLSNLRALYLSVLVIVLFLAVVMLMYLFVKNVRLRKDLEQKTATLSTIYTSIPDLVFCKDTNSNYTSCNPSFERFVGYREEEIVGKNDREIFQIDEDMAKSFKTADEKILDENALHVMEELVTYPDGSKRLLETIKTPLEQNGTVIGLMGISRDITERKAAEEEARVASKAKSAFLAHMSHEIRTPLNAIIGMANIIKKYISDPQKTLTAVGQIIMSSHHLLGILNDVLDMSKIESGKLDLMKEPFSLMETYKMVTEMIGQRCLEKNIHFITNMAELQDVTLIGDGLRLNQVLINLLGNAVKFTNDGGTVQLNIHILEESDKDVHVSFSVSDTGIGMSKEQMEKLFIPFEQADHAITSKYGGTGLGLSISQNLVSMMGGMIQVESELNQGSRFYFDLTLEKGEEKVETLSDASAPLDLSGKRILIVEDIDINREIIREVLSSTNAEVLEAVNGQQAIDVFSESSMGYIHLIFMDVQMPVLNGYEATKGIRSLKRPDAKRVPIIAMTAHAYKEDVDQAIEAGMNGHLSKPVVISEVMKTLKAYLIYSKP